MNRSETARLLAIARTVHPTHPVTEDTVVAYHLLVGDLPYAAAEDALRAALRTSPFFPKPNELVEAVAARTGFLPSETDAWRAVLDHLRGPQRPFAGPKPVEEAVKAIGGFYVLRTSQRPDADRKAFGEAYPEIRKRWLGDPALGTAIAERLGALGAGEPERDGALRMIAGGRERAS